ncbi:hypothetical protein BGZ60DRAFT_524842 [Tricladium varicosporioides]|nr:hypothetical protein BGZ60DRAFT_524842 [Hymenoscyphus varicosporioides]
MKFSLPIVATVLLGLAAANPTPQCKVSRDTDVAVRSESTALIVYVNGEALSPEVSIKCILNCATVLAEAVCITAAIVAKNPAALIKCLSIGKICGCVDCVPGLNDFVHEHGLCT